MRPRTCMLSPLLTIFLGTMAMAAELPKEGTFSGTVSAYGTYKATSIGKERLLVVLDENGLGLTNGLLDHTTWHCWGLEDYTNGVGQFHGYCVATDPAGDQIVGNLGPDEKHTPDQKSWNSSLTFTTGTGKYAGISGGYTSVIHAHEFGPLPDGAYVVYVTFQGTYKLP